jgi:hypothetical protein
MQYVFLFLGEVREHEYDPDLHELDWLDRWNSWDIEPSLGTIVFFTNKEYGYEEYECATEDSLSIFLEESIWNLRCDRKGKYTNNHIHEMTLEIKIVIPLIELTQGNHAFSDGIR